MKFKREAFGTSAKLFIIQLKKFGLLAVTSLNYIGKMITGSADSSQLGGPIRIAKITGQVAEHGFIPFLSIMAYISISLGFNKFISNSYA